MNPESLLAMDLALTGAMSAVSLVAVAMPFYRGLEVCFRARAATRRLKSAELRRGESRGGIQPLATLLMRTLRQSLRESDTRAYPSAFLLDAARQYVVNEYDAHYARLISMYANLLPPIGFIGTTAGLLILFFSMHLSNESLELGALALALTSSIFALIGFATLEGLKIRLYGRLLACLAEPSLGFQQVTEDHTVGLAPAPRP